MGNMILRKFSITAEQFKWLADVKKQTGAPMSYTVRQSLEAAMTAKKESPAESISAHSETKK